MISLLTISEMTYYDLVDTRLVDDTTSCQEDIIRLFTNIVRAAEGEIPPLRPPFMEHMCELAVIDFMCRTEAEKFTGPYSKILSIARGPVAQRMQEIWKKVCQHSSFASLSHVVASHIRSYSRISQQSRTTGPYDGTLFDDSYHMLQGRRRCSHPLFLFAAPSIERSPLWDVHPFLPPITMKITKSSTYPATRVCTILNIRRQTLPRAYRSRARRKIHRPGDHKRA